MAATAARIRPTAVAGTFYPADPAELRGALEAAFADSRGSGDDQPPPKALIVPHAALAYSGPVAASGYRALGAARDHVRRVVVLGPSHFVPVDGVAFPEAGMFATPLGEIPVDGNARVLLRHTCIESDFPHAQEHSLELQLPFLQTVLGAFTLVPLAVGRTATEEVARVLDALWDGPETLIVVSTDLSHYLDHAAACARDRRTADSILALRHDAISDLDACGAHPLRGLLLAAEERRLSPALLDLRTSGDASGDHAQVVGYGAFALR